MPCPVTGMTKSKPIAEVYIIQYDTTCLNKVRQVLRYSFYVPADAVRPLAVLIATGHMWVIFMASHSLSLAQVHNMHRAALLRHQPFQHCKRQANKSSV